MDDNKDIDDLSRSSLENFKMNPPAGAWNAIDADLSAKQAMIQKPKTKHTMLISSVVMLLLISFISFYYLAPSNYSKSTGNIDSSIQTNNKNQQTVTIASGGANNKSLKTMSSEVKNSSDSEHVKINSISHFIKKQTKVVFPADNDIPEKEGNKVAVNEFKKIQKVNDENTGRGKNTVIDKNIEGFNIISKTNSVAINPLSNKSQVSINHSGYFVEKSNVASPKPVNSTEQTSEQLTISPMVAAMNNVKNDSVPLNQKSSRWSIEGYYSPDYAKNHLKDNNHSNEDATEFYENEKRGYSFTTGFSMRYELTKKWSISAGVTYSTIAYSISQHELYSGYSANNELHYQYPTSCGIIQMPGADYPVLSPHDSINLKAGCSQKIKFIKIPLEARFTVTKKKLSFFSDLGFSPVFMMQERAKVTIQNSETTITNNIDGLKKMNYEFLFGLGVQYNIFNGAGIFIEPSFGSAITSLTRDIPVNCYPYSFGVATGVSFHF